MKKNLRVVHICGFRGLLLFLFIISCLVAGFVVFPALLSMHIWNYSSEKTGLIPTINFFQGLLLWAIIAFSTFLFSKRKFIVSFKAPQELSEEEVKDVVSKIKEINSSFKEDIKKEDVVSKK